MRKKERNELCPRKSKAWANKPIGRAAESVALSAGQRNLILKADTFFIATVPGGRAADVSHRGGYPGFVRVPDGRRLSWDDYPGNAMFNTLGNLRLDPEAGSVHADQTLSGACL